MTRDAIAAELVAQGYVRHGVDFLEGPAVLSWRNDRPYLVRTCYEFVEERWEGFATLDPLDVPSNQSSEDITR